MVGGRSKQDFLEFLDWVSNKGLLPLNTAHARKAVANKVLATLEGQELDDVTALDIDNVMIRFSNKFGKRYTPESLRTYKSRLETSLGDFTAYCANPVGFKPMGRSPSRRKVAEDGGENSGAKSISDRGVTGNAKERNLSAPFVEAPATNLGNIVPVQIRPDLTVRIGPIPYDLSANEAKRIANVIMALAILEA